MIKELMFILNYLAIGWIGLVFSFILFSLIFRVEGEKKHLKSILVVTVMAFSVFAFNYEPSVYTDLYRHYKVIDLIRRTGIGFYNSEEIVTSLLFDIVAKTDYNQFLPFIVSLIRYSLFFTMLYKFVQKYEVKGYYLKLFAFFHFAFFPLIESISGIRYYFAVTVLTYALVADFYFKDEFFKSIKGKLIYILAPLIHVSSSMFLGLRLLVIDKIYKFIKPLRFALIFWTVFSTKIAELLQKVGSEFTNLLAKMLLFYSEEERYISYKLTIARLAMILIVYSMFYFIKIKDSETYKLNLKYYNLMELFLIFALGSIFKAVIFQRSAFFMAIVCMPLFFSFFKSEFINKDVKWIYEILLIVLSLGMFSNQVYGLVAGYF